MNSTIRMSPYKFLFGREASLPLDNMILDNSGSDHSELQTDSPFTVDQRVLMRNQGKHRPICMKTLTASTVELEDGKR